MSLLKIAIDKINSAKNSTEYTDEELTNMIDCSYFIINMLNDINGKTVKTKNLIGKDIELHISFDVKFRHNYCYVEIDDHQTLIYLKEYFNEQIKLFLYHISDTQQRICEVRVSNNGFSTALLLNYDWDIKIYKPDNQSVTQNYVFLF